MTNIEENRVLHGDSLAVLQTLPDASFDAVITDPPYSSGGLFRSDRMGETNDKYTQGGTAIIRPEFAGDNRDQRSWIMWMTLWLSECQRVLKQGAYVLIFTDWRQLPATTDAIQSGGFIWRGVAAWDKGPGARAPHTGYFRHQCEYVVWGSNGSLPAAEHGGPFPGVIQCTVKQADKHHITGKPTELMQQLVQCVPPGGRILDPFFGSGTTGVAAIREGRRFLGIEKTEAYAKIAQERCDAAIGKFSNQPGLFEGVS